MPSLIRLGWPFGPAVEVFGYDGCADDSGVRWVGDPAGNARADFLGHQRHGAQSHPRAKKRKNLFHKTTFSRSTVAEIITSPAGWPVEIPLAGGPGFGPPHPSDSGHILLNNQCQLSLLPGRHMGAGSSRAGKLGLGPWVRSVE